MSSEDIWFVGKFDDPNDPRQLEELWAWMMRIQNRLNQFDPNAFALAWIEGAAAGQVISSMGVGSAPVWDATPTLTGATFSGLTASQLVATNASKELVSDATNYVIGVGTNRIFVSATEPTSPPAEVGDIWIDVS